MKSRPVALLGEKLTSLEEKFNPTSVALKQALSEFQKEYKELAEAKQPSPAAIIAAYTKFQTLEQDLKQELNKTKGIESKYDQSEGELTETAGEMKDEVSESQGVLTDEEDLEAKGNYSLLTDEEDSEAKDNYSLLTDEEDSEAKDNYSSGPYGEFTRQEDAINQKNADIKKLQEEGIALNDLVVSKFKEHKLLRQYGDKLKALNEAKEAIKNWREKLNQLEKRTTSDVNKQNIKDIRESINVNSQTIDKAIVAIEKEIQDANAELTSSENKNPNSPQSSTSSSKKLDEQLATLEDDESKIPEKKRTTQYDQEYGELKQVYTDVGGTCQVVRVPEGRSAEETIQERLNQFLEEKRATAGKASATLDSGPQAEQGSERNLGVSGSLYREHRYKDAFFVERVDAKTNQLVSEIWGIPKKLQPDYTLAQGALDTYQSAGAKDVTIEQLQQIFKVYVDSRRQSGLAITEDSLRTFLRGQDNVPGLRSIISPLPDIATACYKNYRDSFRSYNLIPNRVLPSVELTKLVMLQVENYRALQLSQLNPNPTIVISGAFDMHYTKAVMLYCRAQGYECHDNTHYKMTQTERPGIIKRAFSVGEVAAFKNLLDKEAVKGLKNKIANKNTKIQESIQAGAYKSPEGTGYITKHQSSSEEKAEAKKIESAEEQKPQSSNSPKKS